MPPFCRGINDKEGDETFAALLGLGIFTAREQQSKDIAPLPKPRGKELGKNPLTLPPRKK